MSLLVAHVEMPGPYPTAVEAEKFIQAISQNAADERVRRWPNIDLLITHVNGSNAQFQNSLTETIEKYGLGLPLFSTTQNRFADHNDLRFLLRSIEKFGEIFERIFIVVADEGQIPSWLKLANDRLKIVFHRDIWHNASELPNFNSFAIEANLHHIKELSELYVYCNDDLFFVSPAAVEDFFQVRFIAGNEFQVENFVVRPSVYPVRRVHSADGSIQEHYLKAVANSADLLMKDDVCGGDMWRLNHSEAFLRLPQHSPYVFIKSVMQRAENISTIREALDRTWRSRFRSGHEINVVHFFATFAQCACSELGVSRGRDDELVVTNFDESLLKEDYEARAKALAAHFNRVTQGRSPRLKYVCINDDINDSMDKTAFGRNYTRMLEQFRETLFPAPSRFEV